MPRVADHDERRELIARAFQRRLAADGLGHTTFVRVAAEAGVSVGLIQHYFANRHELLRVAYDDCLRRMGERIDSHIRAGEARGQPISAMLLAGLIELLPVDDQRTVEFRVRKSLLTQSLNDPELAAVAVAATAGMRDRVAMAVRNGKKCGEVRGDVDDAVAASMITATAQGLAEAVALEPGSPAHSADGALWPVISLVFTGRCRHHER